MPGFDRTGPLGLGPRTGGGFGLCTGFVGRGAPLASRFGLEPGAFGCGLTNRGRGFRHRYYATGIPLSAYAGATGPVPQTAEETAALQAQADRLREMLDAIEKRLKELRTEE